MRKTATRTTAATGSASSIYQLAAESGYTIRSIDGIDAACATQTVSGEERITMVVIDLPGSERLGMVQRAQADGSRWAVSDGEGGYLDPEFPTIQLAVAALRDPVTRRQMREYTNLLHQLAELTRTVLAFTQPDGALPTTWPRR
ncbi:hypothetical protein ACQSSU_20345 [Micromonospora echinospora]